MSTTEKCTLIIIIVVTVSLCFYSVSLSLTISTTSVLTNAHQKKIIQKFMYLYCTCYLNTPFNMFFFKDLGFIFHIEKNNKLMTFINIDIIIIIRIIVICSGVFIHDYC